MGHTAHRATGRVLIVTPMFEPYTSGLTTRIHAIAYGLAQSRPGWRVSVAAMNPGATGPTGDVCAVYRIPGIPLLGTTMHDPVLAFGALADVCRQAQPTIVHLLGPHSVSMVLVPLCTWLRVPLVVSYNTDIARIVTSLDDATAESCARTFQDVVLHNSIHDVICMSNGHRRELERRGLLDAASHAVHVLRPFVDMARFYYDPPRTRQGLRGLKVITCSRLSREKKIDVIIRAVLACGGDVHLTIVGGGADEQRLRGVAHGSNRVHFAGSIPHAQLAPFYHAADVFASASAFETCGLTTLEALACGLPIVVCPWGGACDFLRGLDDTGTAYAASTEEEFQTAFRQLMTGDRGARSLQCATYARQYDRVTMANALVDIYTKVTL